MMDRLQEMFDAQVKLQIEAYGKDPRELEGDERIQFIKDMHTAICAELQEFLDETGWKPWASSNHVNELPAAGELVDAFHFFMNLMMAVSMTPDQLWEGYMAKRAKNLQRQLDGYDGVDGKCKQCHRALDDEGVATRLSRQFVRCNMCGLKNNHWARVWARYEAVAIVDTRPPTIVELTEALHARGLKNVIVSIIGDTGYSAQINVTCEYEVRGNWPHDIETKFASALSSFKHEAVSVHATLLERKIDMENS